MALHNLAKVTTATTGTGTITLGSAESGFLTFAQAGVSNGEVVTYGITDGANSELGRGTYTSSGTTLTRDTVLASTNSGNKINLSGTAKVYITAAAEDLGPRYELGSIQRLPRTAQTRTTTAGQTLELMDGRLIPSGDLTDAAALAAACPGAVQADFQYPHNAIPIQPESIIWASSLNLWLATPYSLGNYGAAVSTDGTTWQPLVTPYLSTNVFDNVIWTGSQFVGVSSTTSNNYVIISSDGVTWTTRSLPSSAYWRGIAINASSRIIVVGDNNAGAGYILSSDDGGNTWTSRFNSTVTSLYAGIAAGGGDDFVVVNSSDAKYPIIYSSNGTAWTELNSVAIGFSPKSVAWNGTKFCVAGTNQTGRVGLSSNGQTWTFATLPTCAATGTSANKLRAHGSTFLMSGYYGQLFVSTDNGSTWTLKTLPFGLSSASAVFGSNGSLAIAAQNFRLVVSTDNGSTWGPMMPPLFSSANISAAAYGNGRYVALFSGGTSSPANCVGVSTDNGLTWAVQPTLPQALPWSAIAYSASLDLFCVVGVSSNVAATSPDGLTWTQRTLPKTQNWSNIQWVNNRFIVGSTVTSNYLDPNQSVCYSTDGITWSATDLSPRYPAGSTTAMAYGSGVYCRVATGGFFLTSTDAVTWTPRQVPYASWLGVVWTGSVFAALASDLNLVMTSADGTTWTETYLPLISGTNWKFIAYGNSTLCVVSANGASVATSTDSGANWTLRSTGASGTCGGFAYGNSVFSLLINSGTTGYTSTDGVTWSSRTIVSGAWVGLLWCEGLNVFLAYSNTTAAASSPDGITWTSRTMAANIAPTSAACNGSVVILVGRDYRYNYSTNGTTTWSTSTLAPEATDAQARAVVANGSTFVCCGSTCVTSTDGLHWSNEVGVIVNSPNKVAYGNSTYVMVQGGSTQKVYLTSTDGVNWTKRVFSYYVSCGGIVWNGTVFFITANYGPDLYSSDGLTWYSVYPYLGNANSATGVCYANNKFFALGNTNILAYSSNGTDWLHTYLPYGYTGPMINVAYDGSSTYCIVSQTTYAFTSSDGITWTIRSLPSSTSWHGVAYGNGVFCTVSAASTAAATSSDGITWSARTLSTGNMGYVTYGASLFVAVPQSASTTIVTSPDGITWSNRTTGTSVARTDLAYNGGAFVATRSGAATAVDTSADGITWGTGTITSGSYTSVIGWGTNKFIAMASGSLMYSTNNGSTWSTGGGPSSGSTYLATNDAYTAYIGIHAALLDTRTYYSTSQSSSGTVRGVAKGSTAYTYSSPIWNGTALAQYLTSGATTTLLYSTDNGISWTSPSVTSQTYVATECSGPSGNFPMFSSAGWAFVAITATGAVNSTASPISLSASNVYWTGVASSETDMVAVLGAVNGTGQSRCCARSTDGGWSWTYGTLPVTGSWSAISHNGSYYCAVSSGFSNVTLKSTNGTSWTQGTSPVLTASNLSGIKNIARNSTVSLMVSSSTFALSYDNGATWKQYASPFGSLSPTNVIWSGAAFIVIINGTMVMTSPDGLAWTLRIMPSSSNWTGLASKGDGTVVCTSATSGTIAALSTDHGATWTAKTLPATGTWSSVAYCSGLDLFCAVSSASGTLAATSSDGTTWNQRTLPATGTWLWVTASSSTFCTVSSTSGTLAATSTDGTNWTQRTLPTTTTWASVASTAAGTMVAISNSTSGYAAYSTDSGATWTASNLPAQGSTPVAVSYESTANNFIVAFTTNTHVLRTSSGQTWETFLGTGPLKLMGLAWSPSLGLWVTTQSGLTGNHVWTSTDGLNWSRKFVNPTTAIFYAVAWNPTAMGSGCFAMVTPNSTTMYVSQDGSSWQSKTLPGSATFTDIAHVNGQFIVCTNNSTTLYTSPDGSTWTTRTSGRGAGNFIAQIGSVGVSGVASGGFSTTTNGIDWAYASWYPSMVSYDATGNSQGGVIVGNSNGYIQHSRPYLNLAPLVGSPVTLWGDYLVVD